MFKKIFGFMFRKNKSQVTYSDIKKKSQVTYSDIKNKSQVTYSDIKKKFKRYSKSQLIRMLTADQIIIDNMAKEFGVRDVKRYLKK